MCLSKGNDDGGSLLKLKFFVVFLISFGNVFGSSLTFAFLPFMVNDFFPSLNKDELGKKTGYLGSSYFFGTLVGSMIWGVISDVWGRRPVLLVGCIGMTLTALTFGFSVNFSVAVIARFLWGLLNSNAGVAKTYLSEILDDNNKAKGFIVYGLGTAFGRIFGSIVGGFLSQPASRYKALQYNFFCEYPYVLPMFIYTALNGTIVIGIILFVEETAVLTKDDVECNGKNNSCVDGSCEDLLNQSSDCDLQRNRSGKGKYDFRKCCTRFLTTKNVGMLLSPFKHCFSMYCCCSGSKKSISTKCRQWLKTMVNTAMDRTVMISLFTTSCLSGLTTLSTEIYPLLLVSDHEHGGFSMDSSDIAIMTFTSAIALLLYQIFAFSRIISLIGYRHMLRIGLIFFTLGNIALPFSTIIMDQILPTDKRVELETEFGSAVMEFTDYCGFNVSYTNNWNTSKSINHINVIIWIWLVLTTIAIVLGRVSANLSICVMINNSTVSKTRGTVNGLGQLGTSVARIITPTIGSLTFAWSETNGENWPLNYHLTFNICALSTIAVVIFSCVLPKEIEKQRILIEE